jgi:hypothetical protein
MSTLNVTSIKGRAGATPNFPDGAIVSGIATIGAGGIDVTGVVTATSLESDTKISAGSSITATSFYGDGVNLTGVKSEPTIDIVASGAISAGKAVVVTSDGKAGIVTGTNIQFGDKNPFAAASSTWGSIAYDTANNKLVVAYRDQGAGKGYAKVGTVTGTSISWGSAVEFQNSNPYHTKVIFNANTGKVIIVNSDAGDSQHGKCIIGTVSGTSISFGSIVEFSNANTFEQFALFNIGNTNGFVIGYKSDGNSYCIAATISGTTPTFGTEKEVIGSNWSYADGAWHTASETGVIIFYNSGGQIQVKCISVAGTVIDNGGDMVQLTNGGNQQAYPTIEYDPVNEKMMIAWMAIQNSNGNERGTMIATGVPYTGSGGATGRSWRTQSVRAIEDVYGDYLSSTFDTVNNEMYIIYRGDAYQASRLVRARIISGDIDDSTGTLGVGNTFGGYERVAVTTPVGFAGSYPMAYFSSMAFDPTGKKVFAMFPYYYEPTTSGATLGAVWASSIQDTNLTSENFLGFSKSSYTDGQTATIKISGATDTSQVGLSTGKKYYMLPDASLTNSPSVSGQFFNDPEGKYGYISAGIALTTTNLIIKT